MQQVVPHRLDKANVCVLICFDSLRWQYACSVYRYI